MRGGLVRGGAAADAEVDQDEKAFQVIVLVSISESLCLEVRVMGLGKLHKRDCGKLKPFESGSDRLTCCVVYREPAADQSKRT